jgi:hypothetical protein
MFLNSAVRLPETINKAPKKTKVTNQPVGGWLITIEPANALIRKPAESQIISRTGMCFIIKVYKSVKIRYVKSGKININGRKNKVAVAAIEQSKIKTDRCLKVNFPDANDLFLFLRCIVSDSLSLQSFTK